MKKGRAWFMIIVAAFMVAWASSQTCAEALNPDPERAKTASAGEIAGDLLVIRPLTLGATFIGAGLLVITSPLTLMGQNFTRSAEVLFIEPAMYTFGYPLGSY